MEIFEAGASVARTGTGARQEGRLFEALAKAFWATAGDTLAARGATDEGTFKADDSNRTWRGLSVGHRTAFLPVPRAARETSHIGAPRDSWFDLGFSVADMVASYPGTHEASDKFAPVRGPYEGRRHPRMFARMTTKFDDTIVLQDAGVLAEKILLEYKTGKSSGGTTIDGNAHERLSFQMLQYLEVATRFPKCSFFVLANGAFARYRNKYHVNFKVQAQRLSAFSWFEMQYLCQAEEYLALGSRIEDWLLDEDGRGGNR